MEASQDLALNTAGSCDTADAWPVIDGCDTLPKLFLNRCRSLGEKTAHREKHLGIWQSYSWFDYFDCASAIGLGLATFGLERGDVVAILSDDNKEWLYADLGIQAMGGIVNGIYPTDSSEQLAFLLSDSRSRFLFVENDEQLDKFLDIRDRVDGIVRCIVIDPDGLEDYRDPQILFLDELYGIGRRVRKEDPDRFEREAMASSSQDVAVLIYTSGTTGRPKGAMITHGNILFSVRSTVEVLGIRRGDEQLCFLPLSHVLERLVSAYSPLSARSVVNFAESPETVFDNLREVSPAFFVGVPRIWEKIHSRLTMQAAEASMPGRWAFERAVACGRRRARYRMEGHRVPLRLEILYRIWDLLVLANVRRMTGLDRARQIVTGAAPISPELVTWYWALGFVLIEAYGLTECTGALTSNLFGSNRTGSIGHPLQGVEVRIAADGEILGRGPGIFKGYWEDPEATAATVRNGWLHTGDAGRVDDDGYIWMTGRIKDIVVTAGGKNIAPGEIESQLKSSPYIADAVVIGDRRRFLSALIMIDQENVETFAQQNRVHFSDFQSLTRARSVQDLIGAEIDNVNAKFARVEQIRAFRLIDRLLGPEDEEFTPTMKLRRSVVESRHRHLVDDMYGPQLGD